MLRRVLGEGSRTMQGDQGREGGLRVENGGALPPVQGWGSSGRFPTEGHATTQFWRMGGHFLREGVE